MGWWKEGFGGGGKLRWSSGGGAEGQGGQGGRNGAGRWEYSEVVGAVVC